MKRLNLTICSLLAALSCHAQYAIDWFKIGGGGGKSEGGQFTVQATIGQPDAAPPMTASQFTLVPGFWSGITAIQTPGAPRLSIQLVGNTVQVSWPTPATGVTLEQSTTIPGNWQPVAFPYTTNGSSVTVTIPISGQIQIFRLH